MHCSHRTLLANGMLEVLSACPLCGAKKFRKLPRPVHWIGRPVFGAYEPWLGLVCCNSCRFIFSNPRPAQPLLNMFYGGDDYECHNHIQHSAQQDKDAQLVLGILTRTFSPSQSRLLDFGCGGGYFLKIARDHGWKETVGFDIGANAVAACERTGLRVTDSVEELRDLGGFDVITLNNVFEHIGDLSSCLGVMRSLLRPTGKLFIQIPNARSLRARLSTPFLTKRLGFDERYRAFPIHLSYFTGQTISQCLKGHGFRLDWISTAGLGIDELVPSIGSMLTKKALASSSTTTATSIPMRPKRLWKKFLTTAKNACKAMIIQSGLGERLLVMARLSSGESLQASRKLKERQPTI